MRQGLQEYYLMHKNIRVCLMDIDEMGAISHVRRNEDAREHFPLGGRMNDMKFHEWWNDRAIPRSRHGAKNALQKLGYSSALSALVNNFALSLSDCYWIQPRGEDVHWEDVNLFRNDFVDTFGDLTINPDDPVDLRNRTRFDCATSQGELQKKWCIAADGRRYMIKGNYGDSFQQSLNEIFATRLHEQQDFRNYTRYQLVQITAQTDMPGLGCMSYDFCNEHRESISAWELLQLVKIRQNESLFYPLKEVCLSLGMKETDFSYFMDYEIMTDYLMSNTDRHMNNISVVRDPDTLQLLGFAPIYDSGNSMFYNVPAERLSDLHLDQIRTHSFVQRECDLLKYVKDRQALDLNRTEIDFSIYNDDVAERRSRIPLVQRLYERKRDMLRAFQSGEDLWKRKR